MRKLPAATVAVAAAAIALAAPASADPMRPDQLVNGTYTIHITDGNFPDMRYQATSCGIGCVQISFSNATGQGQFYADRWHVTFPPNPAAWLCPDGSAHGGVDNLAWDPATGDGTLTVTRNAAACGYPDHGSEIISHPLAVTRGGNSGQPTALPPIAPW